MNMYGRFSSQTASFLYLRLVVLFLFLMSPPFAEKGRAQELKIQNDVFWNTKDGEPLYSQGGGIFRFKDPETGQLKYYWYGAHYKEAEIYRQSPDKTLPRCTFESVTCYSSADLVNWTFEADAMTKSEALPDGKWDWVGRLGVAYIPDIRQYALFVQHGAEVLIALAEFPAGPFKWHQKISMKDWIGTSNTGDQTVFTDEETGKSYLIYSYGRGRNKIYVSEIGVKNGKVDLLDCTKVFEGKSREGNCMFKYQGKYYMCASNIYGWDASLAYYLVADDIRGPYEPQNNMLVMEGTEEDYAHITQTGFFVTVKGSKQETVIYCGDRWADFAGNGLGYNQWFPLSFKGDRPYFNSLESWLLDVKSGRWEVAADNNYVKNGSFEADRRKIPNLVKPEQTYLRGWNTRVLKGNSISLDSLNSPVLNDFNSEEDRQTVIGEKSLYISDQVAFKRQVSQTISSSPYVKLPDGLYRLKAVVKNSKGFSQLVMYAQSAGKRMVYPVRKANSGWKIIELKQIPVSNGKVEIGFLAAGRGGAFCRIDDVSLVLEQ